VVPDWCGCRATDGGQTVRGDATVNAPVKVLNALISSPLSADVLAPSKLEIRGTL
jgi:hypothetical protein